MTSSLWRRAGAGLEYLGTSSGHITITKNASGYSTAVGRASTVVLPPSEVDSLRSSLWPTLAAMSPSGSASSSRPAASQKGRPFLLRPSFGGRSFEQKTADGKSIRIEFADSPRRDGRPPLAVAIFVDGRIFALNRYGYVRNGVAWRASRARVTLFDSTGQVSLISDNDLRGVSVDASLSRFGSAGRLLYGFGRVCSQLGQLARPDALYAATLDDGGPCDLELAALVLAGAWVVGAGAALGAGVVACTADPTHLSCLALPKLGLEFATASAALVLATNVYVDCLERNRPHAEGGGGGGGGEGDGGGGGGGSNCYWASWEISYDGGLTWEPYWSGWTCDQNES